MEILNKLRFDDEGLIPAIIQDAGNNQVLMLAYMNREAVQKTFYSKKTHFWSRSRKKLWMKGETSGHFQNVREMHLDCDQDTLLIKVEQIGAACHDGYRSCFYRRISQGGDWEITEKQVFVPGEVYGSKA